MTADEEIALCHLDELPFDGARGFDPRRVGRDTMFVVRRAGVVRAWVNACPHVDSAPLAWRKDAYLSADRSAIVCYGHGARFDIDSGLCTAGPCVGRSLTPIPVAVQPGGVVRISMARAADTAAGSPNNPR